MEYWKAKHRPHRRLRKGNGCRSGRHSSHRSREDSGGRKGNHRSLMVKEKVPIEYMPERREIIIREREKRKGGRGKGRGKT